MPLRLRVKLPALLLVGPLLVVLSLGACDDWSGRQAANVTTASPCNVNVIGGGYGTKMQIGGGGTIFPTTLSVTYLDTVRHESLHRPLRLARGANDAYIVSDPRAGRLLMFSKHGINLGQIAGLDRPLAVAVDSLGRLLVGEEAGSAISMLSPTGTPIKSFCEGAGAFAKPTDIAIESGTGIVWVADSANHRVVACTSEGGYLLTIGGTQGVNPGEFNFPTGIAVDSGAERLFVADSNNGRVQVFDLAGTLVNTIGSYGSGSGQFLRPQGLALDAAGRLYVADAQASLVHAFDSEGAFLRTFGTPGTAAGNILLPSDLLVDSYGRIHVTSYGTGSIEVFGIGDYTVPAADELLTAAATFDPSILHHAMADSHVDLCIDVPGSDSAIAPSTVLVAGSIAASEEIEAGATCGDSIYQSRLRVSLGAVLGTYPETASYTVPVSGRMQDGRLFYGTFTAAIYSANDGPPTTAGGQPVSEPLPEGDGPSGEPDRWQWFPSHPDSADCSPGYRGNP